MRIKMKILRFWDSHFGSRKKIKKKNCKIHYMKRLMFHTIFTFLHKMFTYYT